MLIKMQLTLTDLGSGPLMAFIEKLEILASSLQYTSQELNGFQNAFQGLSSQASQVGKIQAAFSDLNATIASATENLNTFVNTSATAPVVAQMLASHAPTQQSRSAGAQQYDSEVEAAALDPQYIAYQTRLAQSAREAERVERAAALEDFKRDTEAKATLVREEFNRQSALGNQTIALEKAQMQAIAMDQKFNAAQKASLIEAGYAKEVAQGNEWVAMYKAQNAAILEDTAFNAAQRLAIERELRAKQMQYGNEWVALNKANSGAVAEDSARRAKFNEMEQGRQFWAWKNNAKEARAEVEQLNGALKGMIQLWGAFEIKKGLTGAITDAAEFQTAQMQLKSFGLGSEQEAHAMEQSRKMAETTPYMNYTSALQARNAGLAGLADPSTMGTANLDKIMPALVQVSNNLMRLGMHGTMEDNVRNLMAIMEVRQQVSSPDAMKQTASILQSVVTASGMKINVQDMETVFRQIKYGGAMNLSDEGIYKLMAYVEQLKVSGGGSGGARGVSMAGTAVTAMERWGLGGRMNKQTAEILAEIGVLDPTKIKGDSSTTSTNVGPGALKGQGLLASSPMDWLHAYAPAFLEYTKKNKDVFYEGKSTSDPQAMEAAIQKLAVLLTGNQGGQNVGDMMVRAMTPRSWDRISNVSKLAKGAETPDQLEKTLGSGYDQNVANFTQSWKKLSTTLGESVLPAITAAINGIRQLIDDVNRLMGGSPIVAQMGFWGIAITGLAVVVKGLEKVFGVSMVAIGTGAGATLGLLTRGVAALSAGLIRAIPFVGAFFMAWEFTNWAANFEIYNVKVMDWIFSWIQRLQVFLGLLDEEDAKRGRVAAGIEDASKPVPPGAWTSTQSHPYTSGVGNRWLPKPGDAPPAQPMHMPQKVTKLSDIQERLAELKEYYAEIGASKGETLSMESAFLKNEVAHFNGTEQEKTGLKKASANAQRALALYLSEEKKKIIEDAFKQEKAIIEESFQADKEAVQKKLALGQINKETAIAAEISVANAKKESLMALEKDRASSLKLAETSNSDSNARMAELEKKSAQELAVLDKQAAEERNKNWLALRGIGEQESAKFLEDFIKHTKTASTAFKDMMKSIENDLISLASKNIAQSFMQSLFGPMTGDNGGFAFAGAGGHGGGRTNGGGGGGILGDAFGALGKMFGFKGFGAKTPVSITGPGSEAAGWQAYSNAMASGVSEVNLASTQGSTDIVSLINEGVPGFAVGTDYVPHDMLAMIHEGEKITPAAFNKPDMQGSRDVYNHNYFTLNEPTNQRTQGQIAAEIARATAVAARRNN